MHTPFASRFSYFILVPFTRFLASPARIAAFAGACLLATMAEAQSGTALVRHAPMLNGSVTGSVQQLTGEAVTLNGNAALSGHLRVPGTPTVVQNGHPAFGGTVDATGGISPAGYQVLI